MLAKNEAKKPNNFLVSVVIPVFNEEKTVANIVDRTKKTLEEMGVTYEVLVIDDGSDDDSAEIAKQQQARVLRVMHQGKGFALRTGFKFANGKLVITLDADGSHKPEEIPLVLKYLIEDKADFVVGSRFSKYKKSKIKIPKINRAGNRLFNNITRYLTGVKVSDSQSGFRAIRASLIKRMKLTSRGYEVESEMLVKALRLNARVKETPISFDQRTIGSSKLDPMQDGLKIFYAIIAAYLS